MAFDLALDLGKNFRVTDMGAGHADHIRLAPGENVFSMRRIHDAAYRKDRDLHHLTDPCRKMHKDAMGRWRRCPVTCPAEMCDVGMGDDVEVINESACIYLATDFAHLGEVKSAGFKFIARQANPKHKIGTEFAFDGFEQFHQKPHPVLQAAAIMVGPLIGQR